MRNGMRFIGLAAIAALSLTALAIQDGVILKRSGKVGDSAKFRMKAEVEMQGQSMTFSALLVEKVTKVAANGDLTVETVQKEMALNDSPMPDQGAGAQTTVSTPSGKVLSVEGEQHDADAYRTANLVSMQFSEKALKVGDSWEVSIPKSDKGVVAAKGSYKVEAQEKVGQFDTYRIKGGLKELSGEAPASVDATYWISVKDGNLVKAQGTWTNFPLPQVGPMTMKITMTRE
jgi:hypothetical protein